MADLPRLWEPRPLPFQLPFLASPSRSTSSPTWSSPRNPWRSMKKWRERSGRWFPRCTTCAISPTTSGSWAPPCGVPPVSCLFFARGSREWLQCSSTCCFASMARCFFFRHKIDTVLCKNWFGVLLEALELDFLVLIFW